MARRRWLRGAALLAGAGFGVTEIRYRRHPGNAIGFSDEGWSCRRPSPERLELGGRVIVRNRLARREVMLCDVRPDVRLLSRAGLEDVRVDVRVLSHEEHYPTRPDGYWTAYVVKPGRYDRASTFEVAVDVTGPAAALDALYGAWLAIGLLTYGFEGFRDQAHHVVLPLSHPEPDDAPPWREVAGGGVAVKPVRTHLLCPFDDPVEVVRRYALPHAAPGDLVTIGETPLAIMQHRFRDPAQLRRSWAATRMAQFMSGEGALGTAGGMQSLVDETGALRVAAALAGGLLGKAAGQAGWFYRLVGPQGRLVDDITGALPPYDKFIVVGPTDADDVCRRILAATGLEAAVVDANDLGLVDVIGRTSGVDVAMVKEALRTNPAGNADESTPLVLIRRSGAH